MAQLLGAGAKGGGLGWWWHTTEDTRNKIDADNLVRDARVYAETLWRLCTVARLPFDYAATADELAQTLERYHTAANGRIDLERTRALAVELGRELRAGALERSDADRANDVLLALAHHLIPVNYTRNGPFEHDLALGTSPLPGLDDAVTLGQLDPDGDDFRFLRTRLERERNRVEHALRSAIRLVRSVEIAPL